jgi:hypothetical protein
MQMEAIGSDYEPCIQRAMGSKELWRHVEGTVVASKPCVGE